MNLTKAITPSRPWLLCGLLAVATFASAQTTPTPTKVWSFDVVSIKPNKADDGRVMMRSTPDGVSTTNAPLSMLVSNAYDIKPDYISGMPDWAEKASFDVQAKLTPEDAALFGKLTRDERQAATKIMLQALLAERFKIKVQIITKELPVYDLVVAKGGPKLKEFVPVDAPDGTKSKGGMMRFDGTSLTATGMEISGLSGLLINNVHRAVIDKTGLKGKYDFTLKFAPDNPGHAGPDAGASDDLPSIFAALEEQVGLKLVPGKGPVDTLTIEHIEQPTDN